VLWRESDVKSILSRLVKLSLGALGILGVLLVALALIPAGTPPLEGPNAIASLEKVELGGVEQWILIRGRDRAHPVLLYLHGGPGSAMIPLARRFSTRLEDHFVVVHWDQRGSGKSCGSSVPDESLALEQFLSDTHELVEWLRSHFGAEKIYLLGHSWGSILGTLTVQRHPELFYAYVGLGQVVDMKRNEEISYRFVVDRAKTEGNEEALAELGEIKPPYRNTDELTTQRKWLSYYRGDIAEGGGPWQFAPALVLSPEYTLLEKLFYLPCVFNSVEHAWDDIEHIDFIKTISRLDVPVYFFTGRHDYNTPFELVEEWVSVLDAPHKEIVWFENSAHMACIEELERFQDELVDRVLADTYTVGSARRGGPTD
jgi:pimeloyl-ACP methyl ester carboxylesterase